MSKYAPGPWEVWTDKANDGTPYIRVYQRTPDDEHITICTMGISDGEAWGGYVGEEEDARLIAAAPDLLAACERLLRWASWPHAEEDIAAARAAIAKAKAKEKP